MSYESFASFVLGFPVENVVLCQTILSVSDFNLIKIESQLMLYILIVFIPHYGFKVKNNFHA